MADKKRRPPGAARIEEKQAARDHRRAFGQNFLTSGDIARRIVDALEPLDSAHVLELGAGSGRLSRQIVPRAARATLLELDTALAARLAANYVEDERVSVLRGDILRFDFEAWAREAAPLRPVVVGNIPYNITNNLLHRLLESHAGLGAVVLMLQEEVALKLTARPSSKPYGMLTVLAAYNADLQYLFTVGRDNFSPRPRVDSAIVRLDFGGGSPVKARDEGLFRALVKRLFLERRKQVQKVLRSDPLYRLDAAALERLSRESGLDLTLRPENLPVADFIRLTDSLGSLLVREPQNEI